MAEFIIGNLKEVLIYLLIINIAGLISMGIDKFKSKNGMWRTKEKTFFLIAIFGGSIGILAGMYIFRHKTKHAAFVYGVPIIIAIQVTLVLIFLFKKIDLHI